MIINFGNVMLIPRVLYRDNLVARQSVYSSDLLVVGF